MAGERSTQQRLSEIEGAIAGLLLRMQGFHEVIDNNARACNDNFTKVECALRASAESIKAVSDILRDMRNEDDWWKDGPPS